MNLLFLILYIYIYIYIEREREREREGGGGGVTPFFFFHKVREKNFFYTKKTQNKWGFF